MKNLIKVSRIADNGNYQVQVTTDKKWELFRCDKNQKILLKNGSKPANFLVENLENVRILFSLKIEGLKEVLLSDNPIHLNGAYNVRDLGGIVAKDQKAIKPGKLFRSDDLASLTNFDLDYLATFDLSTIVDFRSQYEINVANDKFLDNVKYCQLSIDTGNISDQTMETEIKMTKEKANAYMDNVYRLFASDVANKAYKAFFAIIQDKKEQSTLYHCSAGKDRTGMATYYILYALGVDVDTIVADYLQSNELVKRKYAKELAKYPQLEAMFIAKKEYLDIIIAEINRKYKSLDNYLKDVLCVDSDLLKEKYLY